jgi:hypothetical protein
MSLNRPELPAAITGVLGSTGLGLMMPAFSIAFSSILAVFNGPGELPVSARGGSKKYIVVTAQQWAWALKLGSIVGLL